MAAKTSTTRTYRQAGERVRQKSTHRVYGRQKALRRTASKPLGRVHSSVHWAAAARPAELIAVQMVLALQKTIRRHPQLVSQPVNSPAPKSIVRVCALQKQRALAFSRAGQPRQSPGRVRLGLA